MTDGRTRSYRAKRRLKELRHLVLELLRRDSWTARDLAVLTGSNPHTVAYVLKDPIREGKVTKELLRKGIYHTQIYQYALRKA